jgi:hypothetical protein
MLSKYGPWVLGAALGALGTVLYFQWFWVEVSDVAGAITTVVALSALYIAVRWRDEAKERAKADVAVRIISAVVAYAELRRRNQTLSVGVGSPEEATVNEFVVCGRLLAAFFPKLLTSYEAFYNRGNEITLELGEGRSHTLDDIEQALAEPLAKVALYGAAVKMPPTDTQRMHALLQTGKPPQID